MPNEQFLEVIGDTESNPVNAAIIANLLGADGPANVLPVELWNGLLADEGSTIVYTGRLLEPNSTLKIFDALYALPIDREEVSMGFEYVVVRALLHCLSSWIASRKSSRRLFCLDAVCG